MSLARFHAAIFGAARRTGVALLLGVLALTTVASGRASAAPASATFYNGDRVQVRYTGGANLNVRSGPGLGYYRQSSLREGAIVRVVRGPVWNNGYAWYKVAYTSSGSTGWSAGKWLYRTSASSGYSSRSTSASSARSTSASSSRSSYRSTGRTYRVLATAYNGAEFNSSGIMRNGNRVHWGAVAVDPRVIPLGTRMYIEGFGNQVFVAEDTGSAIKGYRIDIWMPTLQQARNFGAQRRTVTIIR